MVSQALIVTITIMVHVNIHQVVVMCAFLKQKWLFPIIVHMLDEKMSTMRT